MDLEELDLENYRTMGMIIDLEWDVLDHDELAKALGPWVMGLSLAEAVNKRYMLVAGALNNQLPIVAGCDTEAEVQVVMAYMHERVGQRALPEGGITPWVLIVPPEFQQRLRDALVVLGGLH